VRRLGVVHPHETVQVDDKQWIDMAKREFHLYKPFKYLETTYPRHGFYEPDLADLKTISHFSTVLSNTVKERVDACYYNAISMRYDIERYVRPVSQKYTDTLSLFMFSSRSKFGYPVWNDPIHYRDGYDVSIDHIVF
jgi:hypothetical protein